MRVGCRELKKTCASLAGAVALPVAILWRMGGGKLALLGLLALGAHPSMMAAARSFRLEQEILFLAIISLLCAFAPMLWLRARAGGPILWVISGFCAGLAATSHVWGVMIPLVIGASLLLHARVWREVDGLSWLYRIILFAGGAGMPISVSLWSLLHDWPAGLEYSRQMAPFYSVRHQQLLDYYAPQATIPFGSLLPKQALVALDMLNRGAFAIDHFPPLGQFAGILRLPIQLAFWIAVAISAYLVPRPWRPTIRSTELPVALFCGFGVAFVTSALIYPPNTVYYIYTTFFVLSGALLALALLFPRRVSLSLAGTGAVFASAYAGAALWFLATAVPPSTQLTLDARFSMLATMRDALHIRGTAYCDTLTWMACGSGMRSIVNSVGENGPFHASAAVVERTALEFFTGFMPALSDPLAPAATKLARWRALTRDLALRGILFDKLSESVTLAYASPDQNMLVGVALSSGDVRWYRELPPSRLSETRDPEVFLMLGDQGQELAKAIHKLRSDPQVEILSPPTKDELGLGTDFLMFRAPVDFQSSLDPQSLKRLQRFDPAQSFPANASQ